MLEAATCAALVAQEFRRRWEVVTSAVKYVLEAWMCTTCKQWDEGHRHQAH